MQNTMELEQIRHKRASANSEIRKFANITMKSDMNCRYYWFDRNGANWRGGWSHTVSGCLHCYYSIFIIDRYTGKCWEVGEEPCEQ